MPATSQPPPESGSAAFPGGCPPPHVPEYSLLRQIGQGSYGEVWLGRSCTGRHYAIKVVRKNLADGGRSFEREYRGILNYEPISRRHVNLVDVLQVGRNESAGFFYYVMELADDCSVLVSSAADAPDLQPSVADTESRVVNPEHYVPHTLREQLKRRGRLSFEQCIELGLNLTAAIEQLHSHGFVHRDIKPSNIIFVLGQPKLADIGLVARTDATRSLVGTPGYVPPEGAGTPQADLFGLGKVLYEASTGNDRDDFPEPPTSLPVKEREVWADLNEIILKACAPQVGRRYQSVGDLRKDLRLLHAGESIRGRRSAQRRLAAFKRAGVVASLLVLVVGLGLFYQAREARRFHLVAEESQARLRQLHIANGIRAMDEGDLMTSLVWLTEALKGTPAGSLDQELQRRRWEAVWRQCPKVVRLGAHGGPVNSAVLSPDGRRVLSASSDRTACVWSLDTGRVLLRLTHDQAVLLAAFSRDGERIVTICGDHGARIWDAATGRLLMPPLRHEGKILHVAFSPDTTRLVTCSADGAARLWDAHTGALVCAPLRFSGEMNFADFSPDGHLFVTASDDSTARVWESRTGRPVGHPLGHPDHVRQARFSPDGVRIVTACRDGNARVFEVGSGRLLTPLLKLHTPLLYALFSHRGERVLCGGGASENYGEVRVWNAYTGDPVTRPIVLNDRSRTGAFSPDDRFVVAATQDKTVLVWDAETGTPVTSPLHHNHAVWDVNFTADGRQILSASRDGAWRLWELATGTSLESVHHHSAAVNSAAFSPDGTQVLVGGWLSDCGLWDWKSDSYSALRAVELGPVMGALLSPKGRYLVTVEKSGQIVLHDGASGKVLYVLAACTDAAGPICFNPEETLILVPCQDRALRLCDTVTGKLVGPSFIYDHNVLAVVFSPDGQLVAAACGSSDQTPGVGDVRVWSVKTGALVCPPIQLDGAPVVAISPDSRLILVGAKDSTPEPHFAQLRDIRSGAPIGPQLWHSDGISWVSFAPDGKRMVTGSEDGAGRLWDVKTGRPISPILQHKRGITSVSFAPDGRRMVTASSDGTARVWDTMTGKALSPPLRHNDIVTSVSFSPDGESLVTSSFDRTCHVWRLPATARPLRDLEIMAEVQAGVRMDNTGGLSPMSSRDLYGLWQEMHGKNPAQFDIDDSDKIAWHRLQAATSQATRNWPAAKFHVDFLRKYLPGDQQIQEWVAAVEAHLAKRSSTQTAGQSHQETHPAGEGFGVPSQPGP